MNQSDMILEFIDGTLDGGREQNLFDEMAQHPELRAELRQYVMIGDAVRGDREAYTPPADVERRLLGGLGLLPVIEAGGGAAAGTAAGAAVGAAEGAAGGAASLFGWFAVAKLKAVILPLVVGILVGGALGGGSVYLVLNNSSDAGTTIMAGDVRNSTSAAGTQARNGLNKGSLQNNVSTAPHASGSSSTLSSSATQSAGIEGRNSHTPSLNAKRGVGGGKREKELSAAPVGPAPNNPPFTNAADEKNRPANPAPSASQSGASETSGVLRRLSAETSVRDIPLIDRGNLLPEEPQARTSSATLPQPSLPQLPEQRKKAMFMLELRKGFLAQPFADNSSREVSSDFLREDFIAGAYYAPSAGWYVGLEAGRERFAQTLFYNRGDTLLVEQRPAVAWGGVAFGHQMQVLNIPFFMQGTLGASQYGGPMARGRLGVDLLDLFGMERSSALSFPLAVETSSLVYTYNGQYLVTGNWGFSGGINLRFGL